MTGKDICLTFNLETIYDHVNFNINALDKVGITGVNGAGKTTLFKVIMGLQEVDSGNIIFRENKLIGYLPQEIIINNDITVYDYLYSARPIKKLQNEIDKLYLRINELDKEIEINKLLKIISKDQELLEFYDVYSYENTIFSIIENMKINLDFLDMKLSSLSGGQKSKVAFARLLLTQANILLLDEPTNHLDLETKEYVKKYLKNYKGMVLIISHDLSFLNEVTNKTMYIDKLTHKITVYEGNYTEFKKKYELQKELKEREINNKEREAEKLRKIALLYSNSSGNRKKMAVDREHKLEKITKTIEAHVENYKHVKINIKPNNEGSAIPIKVNNISFGYDANKLLYNNLSFTINKKERFLIVGENGVGKSTLLKLLINELTPLSGNIWYGNKNEIAYYAQEQEILDQNKTILENLEGNKYSTKEIRTILGSFLFFNDDVFKKVSVLSPGEKARVCLCKVVMTKANILFLDEPTNHLDPETQKIIGENFHDFEGTIIMVSHNPEFVKMIGINQMLILPSGKITNYDEELLYKYQELNSK